MTLSARTELSHAYSFDSKIDAIFKITLVSCFQAPSKHTLKPDSQRFFPRSEHQA